MCAFWDVDGNKITGVGIDRGTNLLDGMSPDGAASHQLLGVDVGEMVKALEQTIGSKPESLHLRSEEGCNIVDAVHPGNARYSIKILHDKAQDEPAQKRRAKGRMGRERAMIEWMSAFTSVPVPKMLLHEVSREGTPYMITESPRGTPLYGHFTDLSDGQKQANLQSYVDLTLSLFRVPCPSYIGSIVFFSAASDTARLGPCTHPLDGTRAPAVFEGIEDYFGWLLNKKRTLLSAAAARDYADADNDVKPAYGSRAKGAATNAKLDREQARIRRAFARLEVHLAEALRNLDEPLLRCVPVNEDMGPRNVWLDAEGRIAGVVDWGAHVVKPAVLAAAYPSWLSYPDYEYPQLNARDGKYMESAEEAERLCVRLDNILLERDAEYYNALKEGVFIRMAEAWLKDPNSDLHQLQAVMSHAVVNMV